MALLNLYSWILKSSQNSFRPLLELHHLTCMELECLFDYECHLLVHAVWRALLKSSSFLLFPVKNKFKSSSCVNLWQMVLCVRTVLDRTESLLSYKPVWMVWLRFQLPISQSDNAHSIKKRLDLILTLLLSKFKFKVCDSAMTVSLHDCARASVWWHVFITWIKHIICHNTF